MDVLRQLLVLVHLLGFATLFGGAVVQARSRDPEINAAMLYGSVVSLLSGVALWVFAGSWGAQPALITMIVKSVLTALVTVLVVINRRYLSIPRGLLLLITTLVLANAVLAVFGPSGS